MITIGLSGLPPIDTGNAIEAIPNWFFHDATVAIAVDGEVKIVVEQERTERLKHTNVLARDSVKKALYQIGMQANDIDNLVYCFEESYVESELRSWTTLHGMDMPRSARQVIAGLVPREGGFPTTRVVFQRHHDCHAACAFLQSPFEEALVVIADGNGERESTSIYSATRETLTLRRTHPVEDSLGHFYTEMISLLGYGEFEEGKVTGLAAYGNASRLERIFDQCYQLKAAGSFRLMGEHTLRQLRLSGMPAPPAPREFLQVHKDYAAGIQSVLEAVFLHILRYWRERSCQPNFCFGGGVAQNCSLNGKVRKAGLFDDMFVHPATSDAGAAIGAALLGFRWEDGARHVKPLKTPYLGLDLPSVHSASRQLDPWHGLIEIKKPYGIAQVADDIGNGLIVGWINGRAEIGPRALGNRSILASPLSVKTRDYVNDQVKQRERFRPLAPLVLLECVHTYFDVPAGSHFPYMNIAVPVRPEYRDLLGAVTHVDGSARVQTVDQAQNSPLFDLLKAMQTQFGLPILLNTSFNGKNEPIVNSLGDALSTFLSSRLDILFWNGIAVFQREQAAANWSRFSLSLHENSFLAYRSFDGSQPQPYLYRGFGRNRRWATLSRGLSDFMQDHRLFKGQPGDCPIATSHIQEILELWRNNFVVISPRAAG